MSVGPARFRFPRISPGPGPSNEGLVVQAVLLMALVTTIGIFVIAARVAGSRLASTAASLSMEARQAAEFGYSEILADINRDSKSYLWVTKWNGNNWASVTADDLSTCGIASTSDSLNTPVAGVSEPQFLPGSTELSYQLIEYKEPGFIEGSNPTGKCPMFGNLIGGTAEITILGTINRGGSVSTYTLKRTVSVRRSAPIFNNPITAPPSSRAALTSNGTSDSRFPAYPQAPSGPVAPNGKPYDLTCAPDPTSPTITCSTPAPDSLKATFKSPNSSSDEEETSPLRTLHYFPYIPSSANEGIPWPQLCGPPSGNPAVISCLVGNMTIKANADLLVKTNTAPVLIFLSGDMTIEPGARLSGDDWANFRIFGITAAGACGSQTITINPYFNKLSTLTTETNLQNAFVWLAYGKLKYGSITPLTSVPALVGSVCLFESTVAAPANLSTLSNHSFFEKLGGAYDFQGLFGAPVPIRFFYRGFGFYEQNPAS